MQLQYLKGIFESDMLSERQRRIYNFLSSRNFGVLSTVTPNGDPHGVVVYYVIDPDFTIHILTKTGTRKYDNMIHNKHVMLTITEPISQTTAQVSGAAVEDATEEAVTPIANKIFRQLSREYRGLPPITKLQAGSFTTFSIEPTQIRMAMFARPDAGEYEELFDSIESFNLKD